MVSGISQWADKENLLPRGQQKGASPLVEDLSSLQPFEAHFDGLCRPAATVVDDVDVHLIGDRPGLTADLRIPDRGLISKSPVAATRLGVRVSWQSNGWRR